MKYILHIDTSGDNGFVALGADGKLVAFKENPEARNQAASVNNDINEILSAAGIALKDLSAVAVCGGPGSYTGLRIGLSTAKALCYALNIPLMQHDRLTLMILGQCHKFLSEYDVYLAVLIAREQEYYISSYNNNFEPIISPRHIAEDEFKLIINKIDGKLLTIGDISKGLKQIVNSDIIQDRRIKIETWIMYAFERFNCNEFVNLSTIEPIYLKQVFTHKPKNIN